VVRRGGNYGRCRPFRCSRSPPSPMRCPAPPLAAAAPEPSACKPRMAPPGGGGGGGGVFRARKCFFFSAVFFQLNSHPAGPERPGPVGRNRPPPSSTSPNRPQSKASFRRSGREVIGGREFRPPAIAGQNGPFNASRVFRNSLPPPHSWSQESLSDTLGKSATPRRKKLPENRLRPPPGGQLAGMVPPFGPEIGPVWRNTCFSGFALK